MNGEPFVGDDSLVFWLLVIEMRCSCHLSQIFCCKRVDTVDGRNPVSLGMYYKTYIVNNR